MALALSGCQAHHARPDLAAIEDGSPQRLAMNTRVYDDAVRRVSRRHFDRPRQAEFRREAQARRAAAIERPDEESFYDALNGALGVLDDDHTNALGPAVVRELEILASGEALHFGFAARLITDAETQERRYYVTSVFENGPAQAAGVQPGWWVKALNGAPWETSRYQDGDEILVFEDPAGEERVVTLRRAPVRRPIGLVRRRPDGVAVVAFGNFSRRSLDWLKTALTELQADPPSAVLLDLRRNPGGSLGVAPDVVGAFFSEPFRFIQPVHLDLEGRFFATVFRTVPTRTVPFDHGWTGPLAVVVSPDTASAAEIFAATIQDCRRGVIVGETTMGATAMSVDYRLPDGGVISVGIGEMLTFKGRIIEKVGVTPDIVIAPSFEDGRAARDVVLDAAARAAIDYKSDGRCVGAAGG
ncbi:MAG TPA: S41 family peptidase [Brevundimonas sp.]|nr:S41 family peptidase [Brevundimonas sp.]